MGRKLDKIIKRIMIAIFCDFVRDRCLRKFWIGGVMYVSLKVLIPINWLINPRTFM